MTRRRHASRTLPRNAAAALRESRPKRQVLQAPPAPEAQGWRRAGKDTDPMHDTILQSIGWTPLVRLRRLAEQIPATVCVKVESLNPGGSVKDRVALRMVQEAEQRGWLRPGGTIIEATAGNTGVGLAMVGAVKGYRCIFVLPDKMSNEKIALLKAYGAEVVVTATNVPPDS